MADFRETRSLRKEKQTHSAQQAKARLERRKRQLRRLGWTVGLLAVLAGTIVVGRAWLGEVRLSGFADALRLVGRGGDGYPCAFSYDGTRQTMAVGDSIALLGPTHLEIRTPNAYVSYSDVQPFAQPALQAAKGRLLLFDRATGKLMLLSKTGVLLQKQLDQAIFCATLNEQGSFAAATRADGAAAVVYAWDSKEKQLLAWRCENEYPSALQLSKNGRSFAICLVGTEQATNYARFVAFSFHKKDPVTDLRIDGAWLYGVAQVSGGWLAVGDKAIYRIKRDASEDFSYENRGLDRFDVGNGGVCAVLLEDWDNRSLLRAYNRRGDLVLEQGFAQRPLDLVCDGNTVYLRFATFLLRWSKALGFRQSQALPKNTQKALVTGTEAYLLTVNSVERQKLRWGAAEESLFY